MQSLIVNKGTLFAGDYVVMVDAAWNSESNNQMDFREVLIDVYCPKQVTIEAMPIKDGFDVLVKATKKFAIANGTVLTTKSNCIVDWTHISCLMKLQYHI